MPVTAWGFTSWTWPCEWWHTGFTQPRESEYFPTSVTLFLISVPTNGMMVQIWLRKKKCKEILISLSLSKTYFFFLVLLGLVSKQLILCPNSLNLHSYRQLSSSWNCSVFLRTDAPYFSPSRKSTFPGRGYWTHPLLWVGKWGFLAQLPGMRETEQVPPSHLLPAVPWPVKSGLLFDFYCPKWEKEYVFELEESSTAWVIQVYSLTFLRRS